ncbi:hypothetical protein ABK040_006340 [Willaertia magna]
MLRKHLKEKGFSLILASTSPRRRKILIENGGLLEGTDFSIIPSTFDEKSLNKSLFSTPNAFVQENSMQKAKDIYTKHKEQYNKLIVIGSDSIVVHKDKILEKPISEQEAKEMLKMLSGNTHKVISGVSIFIKDNFEEKLFTFDCETFVTFDTLSEKEIISYIETGEPMDKAGSYGIQDLGAQFVTKIEGDFFNVMGLPFQKLYKHLLEHL